MKDSASKERMHHQITAEAVPKGNFEARRQEIALDANSNTCLAFIAIQV